MKNKTIIALALVALAVSLLSFFAVFIYSQKPAKNDTVAEVDNQQESPPEDIKEPEITEVSEEPEPEPAPEEEIDPTELAVEEALSEMSLEEKVYQMMIVTPEALTDYSLVTQAGEATRAAIEKRPVGGIVYFADNLTSAEQTSEMLKKTQEYSIEITGHQMFLCIDEEGGKVARCEDKLGATRLSPMFDYKDKGPDVAFDNAKTIAEDISSIGFNLDLAPVADTWTNSENKVIGSRAYSDNHAQAAELIEAAVKGFHSGGVLCTLKHFPGHGNTSGDSHTSAVYNNRSLDELKEAELLPFASGISAGADFVMMGHITVPDMDDKPATLSHRIVTDLLRDEMGFDGLIVTDALQMGAITDLYSTSDAAVLAVEAGNDLLLMPDSLDTAVSAIVAAVESGRISEERIDESLRRILTVKINLTRS